MSVITTEVMGSRTCQRNKDAYTASRTFLVYSDTGTLTLENAINSSGGVSFSDSHPDIMGIYANGFNINASTERKGTWQVTWNYAKPEETDDAGGDDDVFDDDGDNTEIDPEDGGVFEPPTDPTGGGASGSETEDEVGDEGVGEAEPDPTHERLYTGVSITTGLALVDGWLGGAAIPSNGTQVETAISTGTQIHEGGKPVTVTVPTTEIALTETTFGEYYYLNGVQLKAGMRNSSSFYGFDTGSVLFKGMSVQRNDINTWDATYNFIWDAFSHMRQVPSRDDNGDVVVEEGVVVVYWKQPFPATTSFTFSP